MKVAVVFGLLLALVALCSVVSATKSELQIYREFQNSYLRTALRGVDIVSREVNNPYVSDDAQEEAAEEFDVDFDEVVEEGNKKKRTGLGFAASWRFCPASSFQSRSSQLFGIVTAFAPEAIEVVSKLSGNVHQIDIAGRRFFLGKLDNKKVIVVASGVGTNNAALTTQLLLDHFRVSRLFFTGIAGGVNPAKRIGDVVVSEKWGNYHHQKYIRAQANTNGFGDPSTTFPNEFFRDDNGDVVTFTRPSCTACSSATPGQYPGFAVPMSTEVLVNGGDAYLSNRPQQFWFPVDTHLLNAAEAAISAGITLTNTGVNPLTGQNFSLPYTPDVTIGPAGITSSTFVDNAEIRNDYFEVFHADVLDMESAAFMQVCAQNEGVKCLVIRSLSDLAGGEESINAILTFVNFAARNSVTVLRAILAQL